MFIRNKTRFHYWNNRKNGSGKTTLFKAILNLIHIDSGDITLLDKNYKDVDKNKIGCTLANISLCEYLKLKDLMNLLNNTYKDFDLDYFLQKCKQYQFPLDKKSMNSLPV